EKHKVLSQVAGHHVDIIKLLPPLTIGDKEIATFTKAFESVVADCHQFPGPAWDVATTLAKQAVKSRT
ncbi:MAG: aspartate aminotransferase family protein, partial [bacterium]|nr:aspartate aminotransferase family protein [bacterium]